MGERDVFGPVYIKDTISCFRVTDNLEHGDLNIGISVLSNRPRRD